MAVTVAWLGPRAQVAAEERRPPGEVAGHLPALPAVLRDRKLCWISPANALRLDAR